MRSIFTAAPDVYRGILTFTVEETAWLAGQGFDDMIVAYPSIQPSDVALMVDMTKFSHRHFSPSKSSAPRLKGCHLLGRLHRLWRGGHTKTARADVPCRVEISTLKGAGEVQTPIILPKDCLNLALGDPIFLQHAKASELCERFNDLWLVKDGKLTGQVKTYRGEGVAFL